ncbi:MAG: TonB-dependent receptor [Myxococcales bacterium]|nr:TonB-dependent receptor [Myxococcales bacterium]
MRTLLIALLLLSSVPATVRADNPSREAAKHFQRGVDLYADGDFRGALVEFKKAYGLWPRANVLYDIGQTEYQLLDYASALKTMERYLAETGANAPHRQEVEASVEVLRGRVGRVILTSDPACDVSVDDQPAGTTPLDVAILVSVGQRKIAVNCAGPRSASKRIDVAAGETLRLELRPPPAPIAAMRAAMNGPIHDAKPAQPGKSFITGWIVSGVLVAGTIAMGTATLVEQSRLASLRNTFPVAKADIDRQATMTTGLAITSDILGAASIAAVGVSTYLTIKYERSKHLKVGLTASGVHVGGTF